MRTNNTRRKHASQQGAVLVSGLIFLVVLTMFVLALVRGGTLEERLARNSRDQQVAREAAESMLRFAEETVFNGPPFDPFDSTQFSVACTNARCRNPVETANFNNVDWKDSTVTSSFINSTDHVVALTVQPRYIVELIKAPEYLNSDTPCTPGIAKVTARATGNGGAVAFVQSTYRFRVFSKICD
ncbi:PilX N-terminal domain-containing pilus assembly protein [Massilia sp. CCM 8734]|uniref:pilus assembly PilX family protein n=1 Tax=Massilia sp. CCM 8734 TaxID=2609283 RepID=UPI00141F5BFC|nr:PilX N-terminal domain-containing pilus assembly protein [Massilia sp. CCM 8734]NHZ97059.1 hypothetical protein [Massilia sp. CCM 8734]